MPTQLHDAHKAPFEIITYKRLGAKTRKIILQVKRDCWQQYCNSINSKKVKVRVRDSGCKRTLFRPFSIVGPLQFLITNE